MELNLLTCPIGKQEKLLDTAVENPFDLDISLPEYYPDIQRILKCTVQPNIHTVSAGTDRITSEGNGVFRMLYVTEDKQIASYEQTFPISRSTSFSSDDPSVSVGAAAQTDFVNGRATGQRRVSVHGVVSIRFTALTLRSIQLITAGEQPFLQVRTKSVQAFSLCALAQRSFAMSEVVEVGDGNPPVGHILRAEAFVLADNVKAVKDKLLIKGEVTVQILYAPEPDGEWVVFRHSMPLSQIIEASGLAQENLHDVTVRICSIEIAPKADGNGQVRLLEIALRAQALVRSGVEVQTQAVWDAYSTEGTIQPQYGDLELLRYAEPIRETMTVRQIIDAPGTDARQLQDIHVLQIQNTVRIENGSLVLECTAQLGMLIRDEQGEPAYVEDRIAFSFHKEFSEDLQSVMWEPTIQVYGCRGTLTSDGKAEVRMEVSIGGVVYLRSTERLLLSAEIADTQESAQSALTIYFADAGESVWDIARRYRTTVSAVLAENGLEEETVPQSRMLVIPMP